MRREEKKRAGGRWIRSTWRSALAALGGAGTAGYFARHGACSHAAMHECTSPFTPLHPCMRSVRLTNSCCLCTRGAVLTASLHLYREKSVALSSQMAYDDRQWLEQYDATSRILAAGCRSSTLISASFHKHFRHCIMRAFGIISKMQ